MRGCAVGRYGVECRGICSAVDTVVIAICVTTWPVGVTELVLLDGQDISAIKVCPNKYPPKMHHWLNLLVYTLNLIIYLMFSQCHLIISFVLIRKRYKWTRQIRLYDRIFYLICKLDLLHNARTASIVITVSTTAAVTVWITLHLKASRLDIVTVDAIRDTQICFVAKVNSKSNSLCVFYSLAMARG